MDAPLGRYRIVERGRKLVTIDTLTGLEVSSVQGSAGIEDMSNSKRPSSFGFDLKGRSASPAPMPAPAAAPKSSQLPLPPARTVTTPKKEAGVPRGIPDLEMPSLSGMGRQGRQSLVAVVAVVVVLILFVTSMWVLAILALAISKDVREFAFKTLPGLAKSFIDGG